MTLKPDYGEIYFADLKPVAGSETDGTRPVLIVSNNMMNEFSETLLIAPMTRSDEAVKRGPFNIFCNINEVAIMQKEIDALKENGHHYAPTNSFIKVNQSRAISKSRLIGRVGHVKSASIVLQNVRESLIDSFALDSCDICVVPLRPGGLICPKCKKVHRRACKKCNAVINKMFKYCPHCGKEE